RVNTGRERQANRDQRGHPLPDRARPGEAPDQDAPYLTRPLRGRAGATGRTDCLALRRRRVLTTGRWLPHPHSPAATAGAAIRPRAVVSPRRSRRAPCPTRTPCTRGGTTRGRPPMPHGAAPGRPRRRARAPRTALAGG